MAAIAEARTQVDKISREKVRLLFQSQKEIVEYFVRIAEASGLESLLSDDLRAIVFRTIKHLGNPEDERLKTREAQELESRWYLSLQKGSPDYGVYREEIYLAEMIACFLCYSRKHLLNIQKPTSLFDRSIFSQLQSIDSVVDLGSGISFTTACLKELYPEATVSAYDLDGSPQSRIAKLLATEYGFDFVTDITHLGKTDLVFASEYFEHILEPVAHLEALISELRPRYWLIANSFGAKAIGHFNAYHYRGSSFDPKKISRIFNETLRHRGYRKVKTKLWNNRPSLWVKV